jgi:hypothetical protein
MIETEYFKTRPDGVILLRTYSDKGNYIVQDQTGAKYSEAIDVQPLKYSYTETDEPIEEPEEATE